MISINERAMFDHDIKRMLSVSDSDLATKFSTRDEVRMFNAKFGNEIKISTKRFEIPNIAPRSKKLM
ncbi:MAG: hypothetical protein K1X85_12830 [Ignavibacteria bacterium]|nr:hypothetical protein [Ignavibacteria bacterium]